MSDEQLLLLGERLREERLHAGFSRKSLETILQLRSGAFAELEKGRDVPFYYLIQLADLGLDIKYVIYGMRRLTRDHRPLEGPASRLAAIREHMELNKDEVAEATNCSYRQWISYEFGLRELSAHVLKHLVYLGFNANWILTGDGEMFLQPGDKARIPRETDASDQGEKP